MIATGGLLRMNRRQDSLRAKNRAENKRKRKAKKKKKNDVVVVKGKINLCSPAGLVAAVGILVLMVGVSMAVLGYWPSQSHTEYQARRRTDRGYATAPAANVSSETLNESERHDNGSSVPGPAPRCGFLCDFLDNYLYSDNLKVFGPLVMGVGIFLFICANAVLHENRDKKTKVINLRDIYSTVIDLHSLRSKESGPPNGVVNYSQARSAEGAGKVNAKLTRSSWPSAAICSDLGSDDVFRRPSLIERPRSWSRDVQTFTDTVYSIYKDYSNSSDHTPQPRPWETTSIVTSSVNAFTLPVIKLNNCEVEEAAGRGRSQEEERVANRGRSQEEVVIETAVESPSNEEDAMSHTEETQATDLDSSSDQPREEEPGAGQSGARLSRLSLTSLSGDGEPRPARRCSLSLAACGQSERVRRFSCPRLERSNSKGYIKLSDLGGDSFDLGGDSFDTAVTADTEGGGDAQGQDKTAEV